MPIFPGGIHPDDVGNKRSGQIQSSRPIYERGRTRGKRNTRTIAKRIERTEKSNERIQRSNGTTRQRGNGSEAGWGPSRLVKMKKKTTIVMGNAATLSSGGGNKVN